MATPGARYTPSWRRLFSLCGGDRTTWAVAVKPNYDMVLAYLKKQKNYAWLLPQLSTCGEMLGYSRKKIARDALRAKVPASYIAQYIGVHDNPRALLSKSHYKAAVRSAQWLYHHFKTKGVPSWMMSRIPSKIRPVVMDILTYNGVKVRTAKNPLTRQEERILLTHQRAAQRASRLQRKLGKSGLALWYDGRDSALGFVKRAFGRRAIRITRVK